LAPQYTALRGGRTYTIEEFGIHIPVGTSSSTRSCSHTQADLSIVCADDVYLNPYANASLECKVERSAPFPPTMDAGQMREQMMDITGWIDAGWLYGCAPALHTVIAFAI
jgi:hypothetical protein